MKKKLLTVLKIACAALLLLSAGQAYGQIVFTSTPDSIAVVNELYSYDVEVVATPNSPTFSLLTAPAGMTINPTTGLINWTPASLTVGGLVVVKAQNSWGSINQSYYVYITDAIVCDAAVISYWPMDAKSGSSILDFAGGYTALWEGAPGPEPEITADAMVGSAVQFDPVVYEDWGYNVNDENQYEFKNAQQFSISFWFKNQPAAVSPNYYHKEAFISRWAGTAFNNAVWEVKWNPSTDLVEFHMRDNGPTDTVLTSAVAISDNNTWHHVVAAFYPDPANDSYMHLWVDNHHSWCKYDFWRDDFTGTEDLNIGYAANDVIPYSGLLDEVAIWNKELLQDDVTALYNKGIAHQPLCAEGSVAPIITSSPITSGSEDVAYTYTLLYRSINGTPVTKSAPVLPSWLSFNTTTGVLSGTPTAGGNYNVTLRLTQGTINVDQSFTINVANVNDPPVFTSTPVTAVLSTQQYQYWIAASDEEGQTLTITCPTKPSWLTLTANGASALLQGTPSRDQVGNHDVSLQVSDGTNTTNQNFTIVVSLDNHLPVISSTAPTSGTTDVLYTYTVTATDQDGENLTYSAPTLPSWLTFNATSHVLSGIPATANIGTHNVVLSVTDGKDAVTQSFTINVVANGVNDLTGKLAKVYPVPASDYVTMDFAERLGKADLQILSLSGKLLKKIDISNLSNYQLDVSDLKPASYLYRITTAKGQQTGSIVVE
jgi:hypothetical protein